MPAPDTSNILFTIAHPDLYERNPFNVLNLPVNATAKDIRRRREDIEAAFDAGTEADEFAGILPGDDGRKPPSRSEVADLFAAIEDPERRIAYALFWFWAEDGDAPTSPTARRRNSDPNATFRYDENIQRWEDEVHRTPKSESVVQRHNLAVFHHMMGLAYDEIYTEQVANGPTTPKEVDGHWRKAIRWWNDIAADSDLWHSVSELVSLLGDPRLDYRFARSLRDQFAYAFDQINVELAIDYAKTGREADAKRQVAYMKLSQPGSDDVKGTFDDAFTGLLKQTEVVVDSALAETKAKPKDGLKQANAVLNQTAEPLRVSRIVLDKGSSVRDAVVSAVFAGVRGCLIAYGNETKDWDECLKLTEKLKDIAETEEQRKIVEKDVVVISENQKQTKQQKIYSLVSNIQKCAEREERCACCGGKRDFTTSVTLYGKLQKGTAFGQVQFQTQTVSVPVCHNCNLLLAARSFPPIKELMNDGWKIGDRPTKDEIHCLWQSERKKRQEKLETGCMVVVGLLLLLCLLSSC